MVLKLYGFNQSTCTKTAAFVLNEKNVPFEYINVDVEKGEHKSPSFTEKQPFGVVPYLEDDGFMLYESRAIAWYIATKYADQGTPLLPTDLKKLALAQQAIFSEVSEFSAGASFFIYEKIVKPIMIGIPGDEAIGANALQRISNTLDAYEKILSKQKYLAGDELTLADLFHVSQGVLFPMVGCDELEKRPAVAKWFKELSERPAWQAIAQEVKSTAA